MNELGMLVDVSHTGVRSTMDAIEVSSTPVLFTHANCRTLCDNPRCKTDEPIRALAARGGVMGITTVNFFVSKKPRSTLDDFIETVRTLVHRARGPEAGGFADAPANAPRRRTDETQAARTPVLRWKPPPTCGPAS